MRHFTLLMYYFHYSTLDPYLSLSLAVLWTKSSLCSRWECVNCSVIGFVFGEKQKPERSNNISSIWKSSDGFALISRLCRLDVYAQVHYGCGVHCLKVHSLRWHTRFSRFGFVQYERSSPKTIDIKFSLLCYCYPCSIRLCRDEWLHNAARTFSALKYARVNGIQIDLILRPSHIQTKRRVYPFSCICCFFASPHLVLAPYMPWI